MDPNQPRQNPPQNAPKTNYIQIRPIAPAQGQNRPIQPGQIQFHVPTKRFNIITTYGDQILHISALEQSGQRRRKRES